MRNPEKRRRAGLFASLAADPYRKLAAIALAIGLWYWLDRQITRDVDRTLRLEWVGPERGAGTGLVSRLAVLLPTDQVVGQQFFDGDRAIQDVRLFFAGPRHLVDPLEKGALDLQVPGFLSLDWTNRKRVEFSVADIQRNFQAPDEVRIRMEPERVSLVVEKLVDRPLHLDLEQVDLLVDEQLGNRLRRETAVFTPEKPLLLGPASSLAQFPAKGQKPLLARLRTTANERYLTAILELTAPPALGLRIVPTPSLTIQVLPNTRVFEFDVPLRVDDLALPEEMRGLYAPENRVQRVRVKAGGQLQSTLVNLSEDADRQKLADWAGAHLRLDVWIPPPGPGGTYGPEIVREARLVLRGPLQASVDRTECELAQPVSVTLRRRP